MRQRKRTLMPWKEVARRISSDTGSRISGEWARVTAHRAMEKMKAALTDYREIRNWVTDNVTPPEEGSGSGREPSASLEEPSSEAAGSRRGSGRST